jgi:hypothetical protein
MREMLTFSSDDDLEDTQRIVETIAGTSLAPHDSTYRGGDYLLGHSDLDGEIIVQRNEDLDERAVSEDGPTVVYIGPTSRADELIGRLQVARLKLVERKS